MQVLCAPSSKHIFLCIIVYMSLFLFFSFGVIYEKRCILSHCPLLPLSSLLFLYAFIFPSLIKASSSLPAPSLSVSTPQLGPEGVGHQQCRNQRGRAKGRERRKDRLRQRRGRKNKGVYQRAREADSESERGQNALGALGSRCHCCAVAVSPNSPTKTC